MTFKVILTFLCFYCLASCKGNEQKQAITKSDSLFLMTRVPIPIDSSKVYICGTAMAEKLQAKGINIDSLLKHTLDTIK